MLGSRQRSAQSPFPNFAFWLIEDGTIIFQKGETESVSSSGLFSIASHSRNGVHTHRCLPFRNQPSGSIAPDDQLNRKRTITHNTPIPHSFTLSSLSKALLSIEPRHSIFQCLPIKRVWTIDRVAKGRVLYFLTHSCCKPRHRT